jgi:hypothetical protein
MQGQLSDERILNYGPIIYCKVAREQKLVNPRSMIDRQSLGQSQVHHYDPANYFWGTFKSIR